MIKTDSLGKYVMAYEVTGIIRRLPIESRGVAKSGREWLLGSVWLEVYEEGQEGSVQLCLNTWDAECWELLNTIGIGKSIKVRYIIDCKEYYNGARISLLIDSIEGITANEDYLYGTKKGETK